MQLCLSREKKNVIDGASGKMDRRDKRRPTSLCFIQSHRRDIAPCPYQAPIEYKIAKKCDSERVYQ